MTPSLPRRASVAIATLAAAALATGVVSATATAAEPDAGATAPTATAEKGPPKTSGPKDKLGSHDRTLLAKAEAKGDKRVTVMIATEKGSAKSVAAAVRAAGGFTATVSDRYGYVSATVPTGTVEAIAKSSSVLAVDLNESIPLPRGRRSRAREPLPGRGRRAGCGHPRRQPLHADARHRLGGLQDDEPHLGRPRGDDRDDRLRRRPRPPAPAEDDDRRAQDRRPPHRHAPESSRTMLPGGRCRPRSPGRPSPYQGATWTAPAGTYKVNRVLESISNADEAAGDFNRDGDNKDGG